MSACEAFYMSPISGKVVCFDYKLDSVPENTKEGFNKLTDSFLSWVGAFGVTESFPSGLINGLTEVEIDLLLVNCEMNPEMHFFVITSSHDRFFSKSDLNEAVLYGHNGKMTAFKAVNETISIVEARSAMKAFSRA